MINLTDVLSKSLLFSKLCCGHASPPLCGGLKCSLPYLKLFCSVIHINTASQMAATFWTLTFWKGDVKEDLKYIHKDEILEEGYYFFQIFDTRTFLDFLASEKMGGQSALCTHWTRRSEEISP